MTFDELKNDHEFFSGLRNGEFCLVLGAGFSFGLKNKTKPDSLRQFAGIPYDEFRSIPLASKFVSLSNSIFNTSKSGYKAAANHWNNNDYKIKIGDAGISLKEFFVQLFSIDESYFANNNLAIYRNILLPDWNHIYTFNFDNVVEAIVRKQNRNDYYSLSFPEDTGISRTNQKAIIHLHGFIETTSPEQLIFSDKGYNMLRDSKHSLYDQFFSDVHAGKKLVIIGTQFDEEAIDDKFFTGLTDRNISIYHFDRFNDNFETKPGIEGNPNYRFIKIEDTKDVLGFFEKHKSQIERIEVEGAEVITPEFRLKIETEGNQKGFLPSDFYLSKKDSSCQWYGISQKWDVERDISGPIKAEILKSFTQYRSSRITALVHGRGGSGKSTVLRRLAWDLANEDFAVIWINDSQITKFHETGLSRLIRDYPSKKFLILIEDLYRIKQQVGNLREILNDISYYQNIRLVVGDRAPDDSSYREHIYNPDKNKFLLKPTDNQKTIAEILEKIPAWRETAKELLTEDSYKSSLYLILWTIGRTEEKRNRLNLSTTKTEDLVGHFRTIVESDLKLIFTYYPGVAKALYYFASIYKTHKFFLSYHIFLKYAESLSGNTGDSEYAIASDTVGSIIETYFHLGQGFLKRAGGLQLIVFNHDILAEDGLAESKPDVNGWHPFDNSIKLRLLSVCMKGDDDFSASSFLLYGLTTIPESVFSNAERRKNVMQLLDRGIYANYLKPVFLKNIFTKEELRDIAYKILSQEGLRESALYLVCIALKFAWDKYTANKILAEKKFWTLPPSIVCLSLKITNNKFKADKILSQKNFWTLDGELVSMALNISQDKARANKILSLENFWNLHRGLVIAALNISKDKAAADKILSDEILPNLSHELVCAALNVSNNIEVASKILSEDYRNLPHEIVCTALNISKDKEIADKILSQDEFWKLSYYLVCAALKVANDTDKADAILLSENLFSLSIALISRAFKVSKNDEIKTDIAARILKGDYQKRSYGLVHQAVYYLNSIGPLPEYAIQVIKNILNDTSERNFFFYKSVIQIPLFSVPEWEAATIGIIHNWKNTYRSLVTNTLYAYQSKPEIIKDMCSEILISWQREITKKITINNKRIHYGNHIRRSLGHPALEKLALKTAKEMREAESAYPGTIPEYLIEIIDKIIDKNEFPVWTKEINESDADEVEPNDSIQ